MATTKQNAKKFKEYLGLIIKNTGRFPMKTIMVVKQREFGGIDINISNNPEMSDFSGATSSGTIFTSRTFTQEVDQESLKKWSNLLSDTEKTANFLKLLAQENGVEAIISDNKVYTIKKHEIDRTIFEA